MFASSDRFAASINSSHDVATRCDVLDKTGRIVIATLDVISGSVSVDASRKTRRQCSIVLQDPKGELVPDELGDLLQPYSGYHFTLWRGISWRDGTEELFPLGTFAPYNPKIVDTGDNLEISVEGYDRSKLISRIRFTDPYTIPSGIKTTTAVKDLINSRQPGLRYNFAPSQATVPGTILGVSADHDPWNDAVEIANADGMDLFFDARDVVVMRQIPDPDTQQIVKTFDDGLNSTVLSFRRENDASKMYTGVVVYSEGSEITAPIRVAVWRNDTNLRIPYFFPTGLITSIEQARQTGESLLRRVGKAEFSAELSVVPDPRIEDGDVVRVTRELSKMDDPFVISSFNMPLDATSEMTITMERRRAAV
jgi:Domain of unknown function (DUF5047)